jgi:purine-binding chemotaxis protein CheW
MTIKSSTMKLIEFECRGQRIALPLDCVRRAIPSAAPTPLAGADAGAGTSVLGLLNLGGEVLVLLDLSNRLGLAPAPISPSQQILVIDVPELPRLPCGLLVDRIIGVSERALDGAIPDSLRAAPIVAGVVRLEDGLCLIADPAHFLFPAERLALLDALDGCADDDR